VSRPERRPGDEVRELIRAARAWIGEWAEEGVDGFEQRPASRSEPRAESPPLPAPAPPATAAGPAGRPAGATGVQSSLLDRPGGSGRPGLEAVREALGECTRCRLHEGRTHIVFGVGDPDADLLFVGEGPGEQEDLQGIPFVGRAGELLTRMIERGLGIPRNRVYICNIVKCRPPGNRTPLADEVSACRPFLDGQIDAVAPKAIVTLGKPASSLLLGRDVSITRVRGVWHEYRGIPVMPTFHPAFVLRQYTEQNRRLVWEDLKAALERSRGA
jgi:uracil-DNA glycosylase family 4